MDQRVGMAAAALLLLAGGVAARGEPLRCSNAASSSAIAGEVAAMLATFSQAFSHQDPRGQIDPAKVKATLSDSYEAGHTEFTKDCHSRLAIDYEGTTAEAEIDYQVIETDDGRIITKWPRDGQFAQNLYMQIIIRKSLTDEQIRALSAR